MPSATIALRALPLTVYAPTALRVEQAFIVISCHTDQPNRIQALCFGYFHLGPQMKVTAGRAHRRALSQRDNAADS
jgi:hypothetical protein